MHDLVLMGRARMASSLRSSCFLSLSRWSMNKRAKKQASESKEHAWDEQNIGEKWGGGSEKGEGVWRKGMLASPPPSAPYFPHSLPVSFPSCEFLEMPATQTRRVMEVNLLNRVCVGKISLLSLSH